ncbi:MAG: S-layer homology domain-containing protein, partial [Clostridia bacterium]
TVNTASKKLEKGANIEFGLSYEWNLDKIFNEIRTYPQDTPEESMSAEAKAINEIIYDESTTAFNHIVFIPVDNTGNEPMSNITANAVHIDKEFNKGDTLGTSKAINLAAKESGLLAIPVKGGEKHYTKDGIMELMLTVNSGETELDWGNLHETIFESENVGVIANDGIETKEMKQNETFTIEARAYPFDNMKKMSYFSLDPTVAQVSEDGVVTAVGGGTTIVSALDMVSRISDEIEVTVDGPAPTRRPSSGGGSGSSKATPTPTASAEPTTEPTEMPKPTSEPSGGENNWFADVPQDVWYYDAVKAVFDRKLMVGVDDTHFEPETDVTRGMFATTLYRLGSEPEISTEYTFTDVAQGAYYAKAVAWANANGIVEGYSESEFAPDEKITREQMAAMIYRYAQYKGEGFTGDWMFPLDYADSANVSEYAYEAMCWNTMNGIISGMDDNTLSPKTNSTRAQVAAVLVRLADVLENNKQ